MVPLCYVPYVAPPESRLHKVNWQLSVQVWFGQYLKAPSEAPVMIWSMCVYICPLTAIALMTLGERNSLIPSGATGCIMQTEAAHQRSYCCHHTELKCID